MSSSVPQGAGFETYYKTVKPAVQNKLPPSIKGDKVADALTEFFIAVSGEAQLDAQVADGTLTDTGQISAERTAIRKHGAPKQLTHGQMKDFASKVFNAQLKPGAANLVGSAVNQNGLSPDQVKFSNAHPALDQTFIEYFEAYYNGKFIDRMGTSISKPTISTTITDAEITAAETMLLEFLIDAIDPTPVMGDGKDIASSKNFYPGKSTTAPTAITVKDPLTQYIQIPTQTAPPDNTLCGITTGNVWVLTDLAKGASDQAAAVGGLIANTPGGVSFGLGVFGKISIGDNQTLSVLVKTAASRVAMRATLAATYWTLRNVRFNFPEP